MLRTIVALALTLALIGCGKFSDKKAPGNANEYVWLTRYDVKTLDPAAVQDWTTGKVLSYMYPSIGELCKAFSSDNQFFIMQRPNSTFSNGDMVTPEDIRFTLERCLCSETQSTVGNQFASQIVGAKEFMDGKSKSVSGIEITHEGSIVIHLISRDEAFVEKLKNRAFGVLNHKLVEMHKPIVDCKPGYGAGNWTMESVSPGTEWKLKQKDTGELLKFRFSGDSATRRNTFDTGTADYAMFAAHEIGVVKGHKDLTKGGPTTLVYLQFNPKTKPALNQELRYDIGGHIHSFVRFDQILGPHVKPTSSFLELSGLEPLPSSGIISNKFTSKEHLEITFAEIGMMNPAVEAIVTQLRKDGLDIQGRAMPSGAMLEANAKSEIPILFTGWQPDFDGPLNTIPMLFESTSSENHSGYKNAEVDKLIGAAQKGFDSAKNIQKAWLQIESDAPCVPLYVQRDLVLMRREPPKP